MSATALSTDTSLEIKRFFTVERALYGLFFAAGVGLRFYGLGAAPLTPAEALQSWPIWLAAQGMPAPAVDPSASALLSSLQLLAFWLTPGGDAVARFANALFGSLLLVTPWLLRPWLGRTTALALALLYAVDPWLVAFSRMADGAILATTCALFVLTFLARLSLPALTPAQRCRWLYAAAGAAGLLLVSGPLAWSYLPLLALFAALCVWPMLSDADRHGLRAGRDGALLALGGAALLGGSAWLARPAGLASVGHSLGDWLSQFHSSIYPLSWSLARLVADQPFNLVFGAIGFFLLWRNRNRFSLPPASQWPLFLTLWLAWGIAGQLLPGRTPQGLLILGLPLLFGAAHAVEKLSTSMSRPLNRDEAGFVLITLTILLIAGRFAANALLASIGFDLNLALIVLLIGIGMLLVVILFAVWTSWPRALWLGGVFLAGWLLLATLGNTWQLAQVHDAQRPNGLTAVSGHPTVRTLAADLRTLSAQRDGDATAKPVQVQMAAAPDPLLGWYLRDRRMVEWVLAPSLEITGMMPLVITLGAESGAGGLSEQSPVPAGYIGSNYDLRYDWLPSELLTRPIPELAAPPEGNVGARIEARLDGIWRARLQPFLRWALHHKVDNVPAGDGIRLWVMAEE